MDFPCSPLDLLVIMAQVNVDATKSQRQGQIEHAVQSLHPENASAFLSASSSDSGSGSPVAFLTFVMWRGRVSVGMLPLNVFLNGMSFFTFGVQRSLPASSPPLRPVVVHATYQFADEPAYSYGKRQRFREHGMWKIDPPSYYQGRYLQARQRQRREMGASIWSSVFFLLLLDSAINEGSSFLWLVSQVVEWESVIASLAHDFQQSLFAESPQAAEALFQCQSTSDFRFPLDPAMGCFHPGHSIVDLDDKSAVKQYWARLESGKRGTNRSGCGARFVFTDSLSLSIFFSALISSLLSPSSLPHTGALNLRTVHDPAELHLRVQSTLRTVLRNAFAIAKPADR